MIKTIVLLTVVMAGLPLFTDAADPQLSSKAQSIIESLRISSLSAWSKQSRDRQPTAGQAFDDGLSQLLNALDDQQKAALIAEQGESLDGTLTAVAAYRHAHPELVQEIYKIYDANARPGAITPIAPALKPEHAVAKYRLAWEYMLLAPAPKHSVPRLLERALQSLAQIGDPACTPAIAQLFRSGLRAERDGDDADSRTDALGTLLDLPSATVLRTLLQLANDEAEQRQAAGAGPTLKASTEKNLIYLFSHLSKEKAAAWKRALGSFDSTALPPAQQRYLKEFQTALNSVATP